MILENKRKLFVAMIVFFVATVLLLLGAFSEYPTITGMEWVGVTSAILGMFGIGNGIEHFARRHAPVPHQYYPMNPRSGGRPRESSFPGPPSMALEDDEDDDTFFDEEHH
jgi:hypothetical protein